MVRISYDPSADLKRLRKLEIVGAIQIHAVSIETVSGTGKIRNKEFPVGIIDSPQARFDECVFAGNNCKYEDIRAIIGAEHHCDVLHFERHVNDNRDVFVTEDTDFLGVRAELMKRFDTKIMTVQELEDYLSK